jgi:hypothetical protein
MMAWETRLNREPGELNTAHSAARMNTPEYRQRRRALLHAALQWESSVSHTLRRPAGGRRLSGLAVTSRAMPMRRAVTHDASPTWEGLPWWLGGGTVLVGSLAWMLLR